MDEMNINRETTPRRTQPKRKPLESGSGIYIGSEPIKPMPITESSRPVFSGGGQIMNDWEKPHVTGNKGRIMTKDR
jgi:hypothetical protein